MALHPKTTFGLSLSTPPSPRDVRSDIPQSAGRGPQAPHSATSSPVGAQRRQTDASVEGVTASCSRCDRLSVVWCSGCAAHFCKVHDRRKHATAVFSSRKHSRSKPSEYNIGIFQLPGPLQPAAAAITTAAGGAAVPAGSVTARTSAASVASHSAPTEGGAVGGSSSAEEQQQQQQNGRNKKHKKPKRRGALRQLRTGYDSLVLAIIRPPR
jgi:hypothetical protein